ncbi:MAG: hypothetical protein HYU84_06235 [Chloroflexi bacterium]|nr:hypothetical protein [Chloroflexota bacterium]
MTAIKYIVQYLGFAIMFTGLAHFGVGIASMRSTVNEILKQGVYGSVQFGDKQKVTFLWFETAGLGLFALGVALQNMMQSGIDSVSWLFVVSFLIMAIFVWTLFPRGGAWFLLAEALLLTIAKLWL